MSCKVCYNTELTCLYNYHSICKCSVNTIIISICLCVCLNSQHSVLSSGHLCIISITES